MNAMWGKLARDGGDSGVRTEPGGRVGSALVLTR